MRPREQSDSGDKIKPYQDILMEGGRAALQDFQFPYWLLVLTVILCLLPVVELVGISFASPTPVFDIKEKLKTIGLTDSQFMDELYTALRGGIHHTLLEWSAVILALACVAMAMSHYSIDEDIFAPVIGLALMASGLMDAIHTLAATRIMAVAADSTHLIPFSWSLSRTFNASVLLLGILIIFLGKKHKLAFGTKGIILIAIGLCTIVATLGLWMVSSEKLPQTQFSNAFIARPYDVIPLVIFGFCTPLFWKVYKQKSNYISAALLISIIAQVASEFYMAFFSSQLFDHYFNSAHALKVAGYAIPFLGYVMEYRTTFASKAAHQIHSESLIKQLGESERHMRTINDLLPAGLLIVDKDGIILDANKAATKIFQYTHDELIGCNVDKLVPQEIRDRHKSLRDSYCAQPQVRQLASDLGFITGIQKNGNKIPLEIGLGPIKLDEQEFTLVTLVDTTERAKLINDLTKKSEDLSKSNQFLINSERRIRAIKELLPIGLLMVDSEGKIVDANKAAHELFAYADNELIDNNVDILVPTQIRKHHQNLREGYQKSPKPRRMASDIDFLMGICKDGTPIPLEIGLAPIELDQRKYTLVSLLDISERKNLVNDLKDKNAMMDEVIENLTHSNEQLERFAYICSHDLQEPVRMVQSFTQLLERRIEENIDSKSLGYLRYITDGANRARDMISDILLFCRLDQPIDSKEEVNLFEVCHQVHQTLNQSLKEKNASLIWTDKLPIINAVPSQMYQLMLNLVSNGIKFNKSKTPIISIDATKTDEHWHLSVTDNGIGINPKYREKIFQIFERLNSRNEFPGTGIGLANCLKIVKQHNASIEVDSVEGEGSTFIIKWPIKDSNA